MENLEKHLGDIALYECSSSGVDQLMNDHQRASIEVVEACLNMNDGDLSGIFMNEEHRNALMITTRLGLHLLSDIETLNASDLDHLHNVGLLNIKLMHNVYIESTSRDSFFGLFFAYRHKSEVVADCVLRHIQSVREPFLVKVVCLWLDTLTHYQHVNGEHRNMFPELSKLCEHALTKEDYLLRDARRCGSLLFHLAFASNISLQFDNTVLSKWRLYVILQTKTLHTWSTNSRHCVMGYVCLLANRFFARLSYHDEEFDLTLLKIATDFKLQQALHSAWINDATILIHEIIAYFTKVVRRQRNTRVILRRAINELRNLYRNAKYELTKMYVCYLILAVANDEHPVSDDILLAYFGYIDKPYQCRPRTENTSGTRERLLRGLAKACYYNSIKDAIVKLNKSHALIDLLQDYPEVKREILFLLRTHLIDQRISKEDATIPKEALFVRRKEVMMYCAREDNRGNPEPPAFTLRNPSEVVMSCSNTQISKYMERHLRRHMLSLSILKECGDSMEKEKLIVKCKCMIACLNDDYYQHRSELILAYKHQLPIIPILIQTETEYVPTDPFLKFIVEQHSSSLNLILLKDFQPAMDLLLAKIRHLLLVRAPYTPLNRRNQLLAIQRLSTQRTRESPNAQDLYDACRKNDIDTVKNYLKIMDTEIVNERAASGSTALHVASFNGYHEIVALLLDAGASPSIRNTAHGLTAYQEARSESIKDLFRSKTNHGDRQRFVGKDLHIEWMSAYHEPNKRGSDLRQKLQQLISLHDDEDDMYRAAASDMSTYIDTLQLSSRDKATVKGYFFMLVETSSPVYIIKAYSSTTGFHKYLNRHIAQYAIEFFDPHSVDINTDYAMVKCLMQTVAIVMHTEKFRRLRFCGKTYRGMLLTREDLDKYVVGSKILTNSFLSTSKREEIASVFSGNAQSNLLRKTPDRQAIHIAVLCTYITKNNGTALDIEAISERGSDEKEVLILPFSAFRVKKVIRYSNNIVNIQLEEITDDDDVLREPGYLT